MENVELEVENNTTPATNTKVISASCDALSTNLITIESGFTRGFSGIQLIGNTSEVCRDGKERVKAALENMGISIPNKRIIVSLAPSDLKKDSNHFDLPIAVSLTQLLVHKKPHYNPQNWLFAAELSLNGELRPVKGIVSFAIKAVASNLQGVVVSSENLPEVKALSKFGTHHFKDLSVKGFNNIKDLFNWLYNDIENQVINTPSNSSKEIFHQSISDFDDMLLSKEQEIVALTAATGLHSLILRGSPGTGKSMLASRLISILPSMPKKDHLEALQIQSSISEKVSSSLLKGIPPFRNPHHGASATAILGGTEKPGELSLAHGGILFLDELPEFRRDLLEALREPLETGEVKVARADKKVCWTAKVQLIAASNNCPCGWSGSKRRRCKCSQKKINNYRDRLSGPILDRIDIHFNMPEPSDAAKDLLLNQYYKSNNTLRMKEKVIQARHFGYKRNKKYGIEFNRDIEASNALNISGLSEIALEKMLDKYISKSSSSRSIIRTLRVSRTLADLDQSAAIRDQDFANAWLWQAETAAKERGEELYNI